MLLYNSATHKKETFTTHIPGRVEMYTCGPTVYHFAHIGNLRSYIMEDVLEKFLRWSGYDVNRVMNITTWGTWPPTLTPARKVSFWTTYPFAAVPKYYTSSKSPSALLSR